MRLLFSSSATASRSPAVRNQRAGRSRRLLPAAAMTSTCSPRRALRYVDWADHLDGGPNINGVSVHRLGVHAPRNAGNSRRSTTGCCRIRARPRRATRLAPAGRAGPARADAVVRPPRPRLRRGDLIHLPVPDHAVRAAVAAKHCPVIIVPTAHDEPWMWLRVLDACIHLADAMVSLHAEELDLVHHLPLRARGRRSSGRGRPRHAGRRRPVARTVQSRRPSLPRRAGPGGTRQGRRRARRYFLRYKELYPSDLALVIVGDPVAPA